LPGNNKIASGKRTKNAAKYQMNFKTYAIFIIMLIINNILDANITYSDY